MSNVLSPKENYAVGLLTLFCSAGYGLVEHPEMFTRDMAGVGAAVLFGMFMEVGREACMLGGRLIDKVLPPQTEKLSKSPALLVGFGLCLASFLTPLPKRALELGSEMRPIIKQVTSSAGHVISNSIYKMQN